MVNSLSFGAQIGVPPAPGPTGQTFRIVVLGDFSGRANRGELDGADEIARRKPLRVEFDTLGEVIEELAPRLRIPIAGGRSIVELEFGELDAFDADHLFGGNDADLLEGDETLSRALVPEVWQVVRREGGGGRHEQERRKFLRFQVLREVATSSRQPIGLEPWGRVRVDYVGLDVADDWIQRQARQLADHRGRQLLALASGEIGEASVREQLAGALARDREDASRTG